MTEHEQEQFEAELRQLKPVKLPEELVVRLRMMPSPVAPLSHQSSSSSPVTPNFLDLLRWLIPAAAGILIAAVIWQGSQTSNRSAVSTASSQPIAFTAPPLLKADNIQIGRELVSSFDAVATLPGGEPVRFRCQRWMDQVVVNDKAQGLFVENRTPRVVVVPVGFETY